MADFCYSFVDDQQHSSFISASDPVRLVYVKYLARGLYWISICIPTYTQYNPLRLLAICTVWRPKGRELWPRQD